MLRIPFRFIGGEGVVLDADNKVVFHPFKRVEDTDKVYEDRANEMVEILNSTCEKVEEPEPEKVLAGVSESENKSPEENVKVEEPRKRGNPWGRWGKKGKPK